MVAVVLVSLLVVDGGVELMVVRLVRLHAREAIILTLSMVMVVMAAAVSVTFLDAEPVLPSGIEVPWWMLSILYAIAEAAVVHVRMRDQAHSVSLAEVPLAIGLFLADPAALIAGQLLGSAAALVLLRRQPILKLLFNLSQFALATVAAVAVFRLVYDPADPLGPRSLVGALLAIAASCAVSSLAVTVAISISTGQFAPAEHLGAFAVAMIGSLATGTLGVGIVPVVVDAWWRGVFVIVPALAILLAYRAYARERQRREDLQLLAAAMRRLQVARSSDEEATLLAQEAASLLGATDAEVFLAPDRRDGPWLVARGGFAGNDHLAAVRNVEVAWLEAATRLTRAVVATAETGPEVLRPRARLLESELVVAPLRGDAGVVGVVVARDRVGDVHRFTADHAQLLALLADHAAVAFERGRLESTLAHVVQVKDRLDHDAHHDALTGLPNRVLFGRRLDIAIDAKATMGGDIAVFFIDLDNFKSVNDQLGHDAGDALLASAAGRIRACLRPCDSAARLGGDEFAVLLAPIDGATEAGAIAHRIVDALSVPFALRAGVATVSVSVGVALGATAGDGVQELLQAADIAMYQAKAGGKNRFALYRDEAASPAVDDLSGALDRGEFTVAFQPIVDIATGAIVQVESLARWSHPQHGSLPAAAFRQAAEQHGVLARIGENSLLRTAAALACLDRQDVSVPIAINATADQVCERTLAATIAALADTGQIDPSSLIVELDASQVFGPGVARALLDLRRLGVKLCLDEVDGRGIVALGSVRFDIAKISSHVVAYAAADDRGGEVFRSLVDLAASRGAVVVAKGVETPRQAAAVGAAGCRLAQGFMFGSPSPDLDTLVGSVAPATGAGEVAMFPTP